jgi:hypothetical protein
MLAIITPLASNDPESDRDGNFTVRLIIDEFR